MLILTSTPALTAAIQDAAELGDLAEVRTLLKDNPELLNKADESGNTPLHCAVLSGMIDMVKLLLEKGANLNCRNKSGYTPLRLAITRREMEIAWLLATGVGRVPAAAIVISFPQGSTVVRRGKNLTPVDAGTMLCVGDIIQAGKIGNLDVYIASKAIVRVKPESRMRIQEIKTASKVTSIRLKLEKGSMLTRIKALLGQSKFVLETPGAIAAARGTAFMVSYINGKTDVLVLEGKVGVSLVDKSKSEKLIYGITREELNIMEADRSIETNENIDMPLNRIQKLSVGKQLPGSASKATVGDMNVLNELSMLDSP
jgi:hypothetical protein